MTAGKALPVAERIDIQDMQAEFLRPLQQRVYELYRQIYKGPRYATPDFCFKKFEDPAAEVFEVVLHSREEVLVGAAISKVSTHLFRGEPVGVLEGTVGFAWSERGGAGSQLDLLLAGQRYARRYPGRRVFYVDLLTSPITYTSAIKTFGGFPSPVCPTPAPLLALQMELVAKLDQYGAVPGEHPLVRTGAMVVESSRQFFNRLALGGVNLYDRYFYDLTRGILGRGVFVVIPLDVDAAIVAYRQHLQERTSIRTDIDEEKFGVPELPGCNVAHWLHLRDTASSGATLRGTTAASMLPTRVTIELDEEAQKTAQAALARRGYRGDLRFLAPTGEVGYLERFAVLSDVGPVQARFLHDGHELFSVTIPAGIFNPFMGPVGAKLVELIVHGDVEVAGRRVVDLGTGCGNVGLAAALMGADKVLFTDIDDRFLPAVIQHPLLTAMDHDVVVQNLLQVTLSDRTNHGAYDLLLMSTPTFAQPSAKEGVDAASLAGAPSPVHREATFLADLLRDASQVLAAPGGELVLWAMLDNYSPPVLAGLLRQLTAAGFDAATFEMMAFAPQHTIPVFAAHELREGAYYCLFRVRRAAHVPASLQPEVLASVLANIADRLPPSVLADHFADAAGIRPVVQEVTR